MINKRTNTTIQKVMLFFVIVIKPFGQLLLVLVIKPFGQLLLVLNKLTDNPVSLFSLSMASLGLIPGGRGGGGGVVWYSGFQVSSGWEVRRIFLGLKFTISGFFWGGGGERKFCMASIFRVVCKNDY